MKPNQIVKCTTQADTQAPEEERSNSIADFEWAYDHYLLFNYPVTPTLHQVFCILPLLIHYGFLHVFEYFNLITRFEI